MKNIGSNGRAGPPGDKRGVLLVNLGTPDAPTPRAVRRYLAEFLSDPRVVDYPRALWSPLLHGVILNVRPRKSARAYRAIWMAEGSPLRVHTKSLADGLRARLAGRAIVGWAMRYGEPAIADRLAGLTRRGCDSILIIPLYPQYSGSTTGSVEDAAAARKIATGSTIRVAAPYFDDALYIGAIAASARAALGALDWRAERILLSFHGLPERYVRRGDPYRDHCAQTARLLREKMGWSETFAPMTFQSRFGPGKWLGPSTEAAIDGLGRAGVRRLAVMTPGFVCDCLETLEEIAIRGRARFIRAGGERFAALPCLNDSPPLLDLLVGIVEHEIAGGPERIG